MRKFIKVTDISSVEWLIPIDKITSIKKSGNLVSVCWETTKGESSSNVVTHSNLSTLEKALIKLDCSIIDV